ncbi:MAG TPA: GNAT family N-acetyltransferase [Gammaproteobacteria bacterium]|jgi:putative acetyltransferase|nr:GNAT family N-acetyltransferase [Gammaproteobacteria bacterium]
MASSMPNMEPANSVIREAVLMDIPAIHRVHMASIRGLCASAYSPDTIEAWASNPDMGRYRRMLAPGCRCLVAIEAADICGFGSLELGKSRLASLFVHPDYAGSGVGGALLKQLEALALESGIDNLHLEASLNARGFYEVHGYKVYRMAKHCFSTGLEMDCAEMRKSLSAVGG